MIQIIKQIIAVGAIIGACCLLVGLSYIGGLISPILVALVVITAIINPNINQP